MRTLTLQNNSIKDAKFSERSLPLLFVYDEKNKNVTKNYNFLNIFIIFLAKILKIW